MNKHYTLRIDILNMLQRFMITFTITSMIILPFTQGSTYIWKSLILFQASVISFLIDKCTKHIWTYILFHVVLLASYLFLTDDIVLKVIYGSYLFIFALFQFGLGLNKNIRNTTLAFIIIFIGMYGVCQYFRPEDKVLKYFFFAIAIIYGLNYILNMYFINFYFYLKKHEKKANIPLKQIKSSNTFFITCFLALSFIVMMLFTKLPLGWMLRGLWNLIKRILRFVLSGLAKRPYEEESEVSEEPEEEMFQQDFYDMETPKPSEFWLAVSKIAMAVCMMLVVILVIALVIYGLYRIYKLYYSKKIIGEIEEKVETISPFEKTNAGITENRNSIRKAILNFLGRSNNEKIRKQYLKAVQKHSEPDKVLKYKTPVELSQFALDIKEKHPEELSMQEKEAALTEIYEKARYSKEECSKEEVQTVKNLLK